MKTTKPIPRSILSLDVGRKRIGVAGCDPLGISISPLSAIYRATFDQDLQSLKSYCMDRRVEGLVVGIPLDEKGLPTQQSKFCKQYGSRMSSALGLPLALVNEHSSTWSASHRFHLKRDKSGQLDSAAAVVLLEQWLREGPELQSV